MPSRLRDLNNTDFGVLNGNKNKNVMRYNHSASQYFGTIKENSRLWQMFFFDT